MPGEICETVLDASLWISGLFSVFHAMRILEHGLCALAVCVSPSISPELENWRYIIDQIEKEIRKQEQLPKSVTKTKELQFLSQAASHFWYYKDAWRNHVSHSRASYDAEEATQIVGHVRDFMQHLSESKAHQ